MSYDLSITSPLPKNAILNSKANKLILTKMLRTFSFSFDKFSIEDSDFCHEEAEISMFSHVLNASASGKHVIRVISDDTDVFVLLVFWVYQNNLQCKVQMQHWDG